MSLSGAGQFVKAMTMQTAGAHFFHCRVEDVGDLSAFNSIFIPPSIERKVHI